jgi:hypothetical protein
MRALTFAAGFAVMGGLASWQGQASFYIDSFDNVPQAVSLAAGQAGPAFNASAGPANDPIWGERDVLLARTLGGGGTGLDVTYSVTDALSFSTGAFTRGRAVLSWDGLDGSSVLAVDGVKQNLTAGGNDRVAFRAGSDWGATVDIIVYSSANQWSKGTVTVPAAGTPEYGLSDYSLTFASGFSAGAGPGGAADFSQIEAIQMVINVGKATQMTLDNLMATDANITPVPEASTVLAGLGALGIAASGLIRKRFAPVKS